MIAFIKRHKWWFIGGAVALIVYYLYKRGQAANTNQNSVTNLPAYPTLVYGGGGGGGGSSVGSGVTGSTGTPASSVTAAVPAPSATPAPVSGDTLPVSGVASGTTGAIPVTAYNAPGFTPDQVRSSSYLAYENSLYTKPQSQWGSYLGSGGNPNDPLYLQDLKLGTVAGQNPSNAGGFSDAQLAAWSQRAPAVPLDTSGASLGTTGAAHVPAAPASVPVPATSVQPISVAIPIGPGGTQTITPQAVTIPSGIVDIFNRPALG